MQFRSVLATTALTFVAATLPTRAQQLSFGASTPCTTDGACESVFSTVDAEALISLDRDRTNGTIKLIVRDVERIGDDGGSGNSGGSGSSVASSGGDRERGRDDGGSVQASTGGDGRDRRDGDDAGPATTGNDSGRDRSDGNSDSSGGDQPGGDKPPEVEPGADVTVTPEPATLLLVATGLVGMGIRGVVRRRRPKA